MLTCKDILKELSAMIFTQLQFLLRCSSRGHIRVIQRLGTLLLANLRILSIRLAFSYEETPHESKPPRVDTFWNIVEYGQETVRHPDIPYIYDRPLGKGSTDLVEAWIRAAKHLEKHFTPHSLRLSLVADTNKIKIARRVCKNFAKLRLADCKLRLSYHRKHDFQKLAEESALQAMGSWEFQSAKPFNFMRLPRELQMRILELTGLVAPHAKLSWCAEGFTTYEADKYGTQHLREGCFCRLEHSAYSSMCDCWEYPASLFLVSRVFNEAAKQIFFSRNQFKIRINLIRFPLFMKKISRLGIAVFLERVARVSALPYLRHVEVGFNSSYKGLELDTYTNWLETIQTISRAQVNPRLTLVVMLERWTMQIENRRVDLHAEDAVLLALQRSYLDTFRVMRFTLPLQSFPYLKSLFVHLGYPNSRMKTDSERTPLMQRRLEVMDKAERLLEQQIMGPRYNAVEHGKHHQDSYFSFGRRFWRDYVMNEDHNIRDIEEFIDYDQDDLFL